MKKTAAPKEQMYEVRPGQSVELLKELHILTRDGRMNQDSRRKLKQIYHLMNFIEPLLKEMQAQRESLQIVDHGAGKSYLGFIIHDLYVRPYAPASQIHGIERRSELVEKSAELAQRLGFAGMRFHALSVAESIVSAQLPERPDLVTALHACDTATDDAIDFALKKQAQALVIVPCCQAEIAAYLRQGKAAALARGAFSELWRHPLHTREFASHVTNVLRCLQLEAHGYQVAVTELVGWEHSLKNELIIARRSFGRPQRQAAQRLLELLQMLGLDGIEGLRQRFYLPA
jgi:hypothetical protein